MGDAPAKQQLFEQFAAVGKALSNPKRLELLDLLAQGECSVEALAVAAGLGLSTCSANLQTLRTAGLVTTRREKTKVIYSLAGPDVAALFADLRTVAQTHRAETERARIAYLGDGVEELPREELLRRAEAGEVVVLDVRPAQEYAAAHIPGARSIPIDELAGRLAELPTDTEVVAYCRGAYCVFAHQAVRLLRDQGRPARKLADGMLE
ncbi:transcriptional regulator, ArsR family [Modestobacter sp. DSM 44400]|uniref:ArsR/SmtB family transcription factor n=1 Tax=Modestobacter sp. DSM 44400 TaxID=1550230 RepID=UPI00089627CF|nr:metalloregulator ArsR/SmtB family transcription factor [Modestobacter sp. DSM 44400]SDY80242.1 transcriptional regulator, ArsR family [Modestobacter sp. DSM 44400]